MFICDVCKQAFDKKFNLSRHKSSNKYCRLIGTYLTEIEELKGINEKRAAKCVQLKNALKFVIKENKEFKSELNHVMKEKEQLSKDYNELRYQYGIAQATADERINTVNAVKDTAVEISKNNKAQTNKTVINNTVVIQDFRIKQANEFDVNTEELTDVIYMKSVVEACRHMLEKYYWTLPPNIKVADQARKKVMIMRDNKWVQENLKELSHQIYHKSFKRLALKCIQDKLDEHEDFLSNPLNMRKHEEKEKRREEIMKWEAIGQTWDQFDSQDLQNPMMISIKNLTDNDIVMA